MNEKSKNEQPTPPQAAHSPLPHSRPPSARKALAGLIVLFIVAVLVVIAGIVPRLRARTKLKNQTNALAPPNVLVQPPTIAKAATDITLPGNIYAYTDAPIYARTDGYLEKWYFDIGAHVKKGQLMATISAPEVDKQLLQARADLATAEANAGLAKTNAARYQGLLAQNAVSKQDTDTFVSQAAATSSTVKSALANVERLQELQAFEKIYVPFDGVITARNVDIGQLINSGAGMQMFRIASINVLRVYVNVPQIYSRGAVPGRAARLTFAEFPGESFPGTLVRTANSIDPSSRTLLVEVDVKNRNGQLMPGAYAEVHMDLNPGISTFVIPVSALIFRDQGLQVATVVKEPNGDEARLVKVTLGHDDGATVQVISGLDSHAEVIQNPPDSLIDREAVHVVQPDRNPEENTEQHPAGGPE